MINQIQGSPYSRLLSVAGVRGSRVVTNEEMTTIIDSTDEWIQQRTGIKERRWVGEGESVLSLAVDAGREALEKAGIEASEPAYDEEGFETDNAPEEGTYDVIPATVYAENGKPVKIRAKPSSTCDLYWTREVGTELEVLEKGETWCKVRSRSRIGYMMTKFLCFDEEG